MARTYTELEEKARQIRLDTLEAAACAGHGHLTSSFSCTEILVALYYGGVLRYDPLNPQWAQRDRFVLSKGHASAILYPILGDLGFFPNEWLADMCKANGRLGVHTQCGIPGVEITGGSLGHGLGIATGIALAAKLNRDLHMTFALLGDGDCYEGSTWEAAMFAGHHGLHNLVVFVDRNWMCVTDFTENAVRLSPLDEKWKACGWEAKTIDGHSFPEIFKALQGVRSRQLNKPLVVVANTVKGKGVSFMENQPLWHGGIPKGAELEQARIELGREGGF
jgi:transketolase